MLALYESGKAISEASVGLERTQILNRIVEQAVTAILKTKRSSVTLGSILLYDPERDQLMFESIYPVSRSKVLLDKNRETRRLHQLASEGKRVGVTGRAFLDKSPQLIRDVKQNNDYVRFTFGARSELAAPLLFNGEPIGVIDLESEQPNAFDEDDRSMLEALAELAVIAIQNVRQYETLKGLKGLIGSRTAVEWIKMVSYSWVHAIRREVGTGLGQLALLENLTTGDNGREARIWIHEAEQTFNRIRSIPIVAPLSAEDSYVGPVQINNLIQTYLTHQWKHSPYIQVALSINLQSDLDSRVTVRVSKEWLRRALEIVIENGVRAVLQGGGAEPRITVSSRLVERRVEISIKDTGPGLPERMKAKLFKERIETEEGAKGAGIGLVLAHTIIGTYGGDLYVGSSDNNGADFIISLPVDQ
jgi:signal transduction histidine kinase